MSNTNRVRGLDADCRTMDPKWKLKSCKNCKKYDTFSIGPLNNSNFEEDYLGQDTTNSIIQEREQHRAIAFFSRYDLLNSPNLSFKNKLQTKNKQIPKNQYHTDVNDCICDNTSTIPK